METGKMDMRRHETISIVVCGSKKPDFSDCIFFVKQVKSFPEKEITCKYKGGNRCYYYYYASKSDNEK